jgi:hypothetical protein
MLFNVSNSSFNSGGKDRTGRYIVLFAFTRKNSLLMTTSEEVLNKDDALDGRHAWKTKGKTAEILKETVEILNTPAIRDAEGSEVSINKS